MGNEAKEKPKNKFRLPIELAVNDDVSKQRWVVYDHRPLERYFLDI